jgi:hypothetical protein
MGWTPRQHLLTGCTRRPPLHQGSSYSLSMHLSHAEVGSCHFLQSFFAVSCHFSRIAMQAILPIFALSLYFTDSNDDVEDEGQVAQALLLLVMERYSIPSRSFGCGGSFTLIICTTIFLWGRRIVTVSMTSPRKIFALTAGRCRNASSTHPSGRNSSFKSTTNLVLRSWQHQTMDISVCLRDIETTTLIPRSLFSSWTKLKLGYGNMALCNLIFGGHSPQWSYRYL